MRPCIAGGTFAEGCCICGCSYGVCTGNCCGARTAADASRDCIGCVCPSSSPRFCPHFVQNLPAFSAPQFGHFQVSDGRFVPQPVQNLLVLACPHFGQVHSFTSFKNCSPCLPKSL